MGIELQGLTVAYPGDEGPLPPALDGVDLTVPDGQTLLLTGPSGCGKTTALRCINGLVPGFHEARLTGGVLIDGSPVADRSAAELADRVGHVFQDPRSEFFTFDVRSELAFPCENAGVEPAEIARRIERTAAAVGITDLLGRPLAGLSSGEKQKVAIGTALMMRPRILLFDEPSANLDTAGLAMLAGVIGSLRARGVVGITGANGCGKTTLVRLVLGLLGCRGARISIGGAPWPRRRRSRECAYVMQDVEYQLLGESVAAELLIGAEPGPDTRSRAEALLDRVGLSALAEQHPLTLSGGQKQRLGIALACMKTAPVICLDEPTSGLDACTMHALAQLLRQVADEGALVLVITHDAEFAALALDHVIRIAGRGASMERTGPHRPPAVAAPGRPDDPPPERRQPS